MQLKLLKVIRTIIVGTFFKRKVFTLVFNRKAFISKTVGDSFETELYFLKIIFCEHFLRINFIQSKLEQVK